MARARHCHCPKCGIPAVQGAASCHNCKEKFIYVCPIPGCGKVVNPGQTCPDHKVAIICPNIRRVGPGPAVKLTIPGSVSFELVEAFPSATPDMEDD